MADLTKPEDEAPYPTLERLADLSGKTVGYQQQYLIQEVVACWHENAELRAQFEALQDDRDNIHLYKQIGDLMAKLEAAERKITDLNAWIEKAGRVHSNIDLDIEMLKDDEE